MKKLVIAALGATLFLTGCTHRITDLTLGSTKNYNINSNQFIKGERVTGKDSVPVVIFPFGIPNLKTAIDRAIEGNKCAVALSDVVVYQENYSFIVGSMGFRVEGTEVIDQGQPGCK